MAIYAAAAKQYQSVTEKQTDRFPISISRLSIRTARQKCNIALGLSKIWSGEPVHQCLEFGPDHASKVVGFWPVDHVDIDAYDNGHRSIWPTLYIQK